MRSYITLFKIRFINSLQYRIAAWAGLATQFAWGFFNIMLFHAFYTENPAVFPMTFEQFAAYTWLNQALLMLFNPWMLDGSIFDEIGSGNIAYELARPIDLYNKWFVRILASRLSGVALRCVPVLIVAFLLPKPFSLMLPVNLLTFGLFFISALFAFILVSAYSMFYYIICFYTIHSFGVRTIASSLALILSGHIIPLPFFPDNILRVLTLLPFASMQNAPFFIYSGYWDTREALIRIIMQAAWLIIFIVTGRILMQKALKKVIVQGG
jgi:ABC-2 type transport system permease protein